MEDFSLFVFQRKKEKEEIAKDFFGQTRELKRRTRSILEYVTSEERRADKEWRKKDEQGNPVIMAERTHLYPSRTQKLSSPAPKILGGRLPGKIGHCRFNEKRDYGLSNSDRNLIWPHGQAV